VYVILLDEYLLGQVWSRVIVKLELYVRGMECYLSPALVSIKIFGEEIKR
jgi:hypothetical protein